MDRVLSNLHYQCCSITLERTTYRSRSNIERTLLVIAVCGFGAVFLAHSTFVFRRYDDPNWNPAAAAVQSVAQARKWASLQSSQSRSLSSSVPPSHPPSALPQKSNIPLTCLASIEGFSIDADVTHLIIFNNDYSYPRYSEDDYFRLHIKQQKNSFAIQNRIESNRTRRQNNDESCDAADTFCIPRNATSYNPASVYFTFSKTEAYAYFTPELRKKHGLQEQYVFVSETDTFCFGEPFLQFLVFRLLGPETVIVNWLLGLSSLRSGNFANDDDAVGYIYNPRLKTVISLRSQLYDGFHRDNKQWYASYPYWLQQLPTKFGIFMKTTFLFFLTTTLVNFTLRQTQGLMLDFTQQLQQAVRTGQPIALLVTRHLMESLVFVPIMVGMIFFLIEIYNGDKLLGFMVLSIIWISESFSLVSLRTKQGIHFFPRLFFMLFAMFHFYHFSFPYGFSYSAFITMACALLHTMVFFLHRFELVAIARIMGQNNSGRNYANNQQQQQNQPRQQRDEDLYLQNDVSGVASSGSTTSTDSGRQGNNNVVPYNSSAVFRRSLLRQLNDESPHSSVANLTTRSASLLSRWAANRSSSSNEDPLENRYHSDDRITSSSGQPLIESVDDEYNDGSSPTQYRPSPNGVGERVIGFTASYYDDTNGDFAVNLVTLDDSSHENRNSIYRAASFVGDNETSALQSIILASRDSFFSQDSIGTT